MSNAKVRVRFAPSPTGPLHMGGVRTALFNYLFAKQNNGEFILRIEDTDQSRFVPGAEEYIIESLEWCGIKFDEGVNIGGAYAPYRQSERKAMYNTFADKLIESGDAYYAFDTPEEIEELRKQCEAEKKTFAYDASVRNNLNNSLKLSPEEVKQKIESGEPYVIRFKMPANVVVEINDMVRGDVKFNTDTLDDKVLFKSDGLPTYHLANVVDDHLMEISHVIRGEEWLPSLPLHVLLYEKLGWKDSMPQFAHLPLLLKPTGKGKLSKRDGDKLGFPVFPLQWTSADGEVSRGYREDGYFAEAFVNLLALLGWNPGTEQEIFSMDELIKQFSIERVGKSGSRFDPEKAKWFNQQYLKEKDDHELTKLFMPVLIAKGVQAVDIKIADRIISLVKDRVNFVEELWDQTYFFFVTPGEYNEKAAKKRWKGDAPSNLEKVKAVLEGIDDFTSLNIENTVKAYLEQNEIGLGAVMNVFRLALVGDLKGPHLFDIAEILGKKETCERIDKAIQTLGK